MTDRVTFDALRARVASDRTAGFAGETPHGATRLARALRGIGWSGTDLASAEEVAAVLDDVLLACVSGHRDLAALQLEVADVLRHEGPLLDGSLPPASAYLPAAQELIARYVADAE